MALIADFAIAAEDFVLGRTLQELPTLRIDVERVVADPSGGVTPYFWVLGDDLDRFERAADDDPTVESLERLIENDGERFYRSTWRENVQPITYALGDANGSIVSAVSTEGTWTVRILFPSHESLSAFHDYCSTYDLELTLSRLYSAANGTDFSARLTDQQRETLSLAFERGYFEVPRETTLEALAEELGVSASATSKRLRRGIGELVAFTLEGGGEDPRL